MEIDDDAADRVFKALADPTRRAVLDRLRADNGLTLTALGEGVGMARQSLTQHVDVLVGAGLVVLVRQGRLRLHYLDPGPIHRIQRRWVSAFDEPRLHALDTIRTTAEEISMSDTFAPPVPAYVYVTYIRATPQQVWQALTDADLTARYWGHRNESEWTAGATWHHRPLGGGGDDVVGRVLDADPPRRLRFTFEAPHEFPGTDPSVVTFTLEAGDGITRLHVVHENLADTTALGQISHGWSAVLANLKSLLETGEALPQQPWEMAAVDQPGAGT